MHPDDRLRLDAEVPRELAQGERQLVMEYRVRHRDGRWLHVVDRSVLDRDAPGEVTRQVGCSHDVTHAREAEAALREADRRKDEFLATLAHELRNPLAPIRNGARRCCS